MLSSKLNIHDKFQFEISLYFNPPQDARVQNYKVDTFIFLPKTLNVNAMTFRKDDFYKSIKNYIRLKAPMVKRGDFIDHNVYLVRMMKILSTYKRLRTDESFSDFEDVLHVFCCSLESATKKKVAKIIDPIRSHKCESSIKSFVRDLREVIKDYRDTFSHCRTRSDEERICQSFKLANEYISFIIRRSLFKVLNHIDRELHGKSELRQEVLALLNEEIGYCEKNGIMLPSKEHPNERYIYRYKVVLKKFFWRVLYLDVDTKGKLTWFTQLLFSIAAGISMIFATVIAFFFQQKYGNFSFPFFLALVLGYMGKDRIKDLLRAIFSNKLDSMTADKSTKIFSKEGSRIGSIKERFEYFGEDEIASEVLKVRHVESTLNELNFKDEEEILKYQKKVSLKGKKFWKIYNQSLTDGVKDIFRLNITPFLTQMDSPYTYDTILVGGEPESVRTNRFYHVNVVIRYTSKKNVNYKKYRVVLNRLGIQRIDEIDL